MKIIGPGNSSPRRRQYVATAMVGALISVGAYIAGAELGERVANPAPQSPPFAAAPVAALSPANPWKFSASAGVKEAFDGNVYLQLEADKANQSSLVTTRSAQVAVAWNPAPAFNSSRKKSRLESAAHVSPLPSPQQALPSQTHHASGESF